MLNTIYGVVWVDFGIPMTLRKNSAAEAIEAAKHMNSRARIPYIRAVEVTPKNEIITLWEPEKLSAAEVITPLPNPAMKGMRSAGALARKERNCTL